MRPSKRDKDEKGQELVEINEETSSQENEGVVSEKPKQNKHICLNFLLPFACVAIAFISIKILIAYKEHQENIDKNHIRLIVVKNYDELSTQAGQIIAEIVKKNPNAKLGLATGSSPLGIYKYLINKYEAKEISFANIQTFNLDEYCNLPVEHPQSYYTYMNTNLFNHIDIKKENIHLPKGNGNLRENCDNYNNLLSQNQVDIQLLGIGGNGHIGFNEPFTPFNIETHIVNLTEKTRNDNKRFFNDNLEEVPKQAITMGISNILDAKKILLIANGKGKAKAIKRLIEGEINTEVPATSLRTFPGEVIVIIDEEAASLLGQH